MFGGGGGFNVASTPGSSPSIFGSATPAFGQSSSPAFGQPQSQPQSSIFGQPQSQPSFGQPQQSQQPQQSIFGQPQSQPSMFSQPQSQSGMFGQQTSASIFGQPQPQPQSQASTFGQPQNQISIFGQPQSQASLFGQPQAQGSLFGQQAQGQIQPFGLQIPQQQIVPGSMQLQTQMAPVAPLASPLPDRELQSIIVAYQENPMNSNYQFRSLLFSVKDPQLRVRPPGVSEVVWQEALRHLQGMDASDRDRLWPEVVEGFRGLSNRLMLQDQAMADDTNCLQKTENNVRTLQRYLEADILPRIQRLKWQENMLHKRLLALSRKLQALDYKGQNVPLNEGEYRLVDRLRTLMKVVDQTSELPRRSDMVLAEAQREARGHSRYGEMLGSVKVENESLENVRRGLEQQTEALTRLVGVLNKDVRDVDILFAEYEKDGGSGFRNNNNISRENKSGGALISFSQVRY